MYNGKCFENMTTDEINKFKHCGKTSKNHGNTSGKANKGNNYNKVLRDTNGRQSYKTPWKIAIFYDGDTVKSCAIWYDNNTINDFDTVPRSYHKFMKEWNKVQNDFYHGDKYAYTDVTYSKYYKDSHHNTIDLDKR